MKEISVKNYKGKNKHNIPIKNNLKQKSNSIKNNVIINKNKSEISNKNILSKLINPSFSPLKNELIKKKFNPNPNSFENFLIERSHAWLAVRFICLLNNEMNERLKSNEHAMKTK